MEHIVDHDRDLEIVYETEKINYLLKRHLANRTMYVKGFDPPYPVKVAGFNDLNVLSVDMGGHCEPDKDEEIVLFRILGRYLHLSCLVLGPTGQGNLYTLTVQSAGIARTERKNLRIPVNNDECHITNIRTSKHTIDATLFNVPTSVKVAFSTFEQQLRAQEAGAEIKIDVFGKRGTILDEVRKHGKALLISDTQDANAYGNEGREDHYIDYAEYLDDELREKMIEYQRQKIVSEVIVPINYITHDMSSIPLGFIQLTSQKEHYDETKVAQLMSIANQLVKRIRDSNTVVIQERQEVVNLSQGGLKVRIQHEELKDYLMRQQGFTFDLYFKMQAPITLHAMIRSAYFAPSGDLTLGLQISGTGSGKEMLKRFAHNLAGMEAKLRDNLAKRQAANKGGGSS